ncbi:hypothetical protein KR054_004922 [Drosophila jambulina]|nr:hypothetical protein KR054_004922 [Drosophila jambulina]
MNKTMGINVAIILLAVHCIKNSESLLKVTNIKCKCYDKSFCNFDQCELKLLGRGKVGIFIYVKVHQLPITNVLLNLSLHRKFSGYRPFLYNVTVNFCDFFQHKTRFPWFKIVYESISTFSNLNHTCPYNHDLIVSKMVLNDGMLEKTPFPTGSYMFQLIAGNPDWKGITQVMVDIVEA